MSVFRSQIRALDDREEAFLVNLMPSLRELSALSPPTLGEREARKTLSKMIALGWIKEGDSLVEVARMKEVSYLDSNQRECISDNDLLILTSRKVVSCRRSRCSDWQGLHADYICVRRGVHAECVGRQSVVPCEFRR